MPKIKIFAFCNILYFLFIFQYDCKIQPFFLGILINIIIFVLPGLSWVLFVPLKEKDVIAGLFFMGALSTIISGVGIALFYFLGIGISPENFLFYLIIVTNIPLVGRGLVKNKINLSKSRNVLVYMIIVFVMVYMGSYFMAFNKIDPSKDNDIELQGTSYGILNTLKPYMLTDRGTYFYFAHPLLIHFYSAQSILLNNDQEKMKYYYDFALLGKEILTKLDYSHEIDKNPSKNKELWILIQSEYQKFNLNPNLWGTRLPNIFIVALSGSVLFMLLFKLTQSTFLAYLGTLLYFSFPEVLILSSSEIYTAITNLALLVCAYFYIKYSKCLNGEKIFSASLLSGMFLGLSNHKTIIFPIAIIGQYCLSKSNSKTWKNVMGSIIKDKIIVGFVAGICLFWLYGFIVDYKMFFLDHFIYHFWNRIFHINTLGYDNYPTIMGLWTEFGEGLGMMFASVGIIATIFLLFSLRKNNRINLIFPLWSIVGAVMFSLVDWRESVHLILILPAVLISVMILVSMQEKKMRLVYCFLLSGCFIRNLLILPSAIMQYNLYLQ